MNKNTVNLILPGFSAHNREWVMEILQRVRFKGKTIPFFWEHWERKITVNPKKKAKEIVGSLDKGEKIKVIAKSFGTLVCSYLVSLVPERIEKIILCGIPSVSEKRLEIYKQGFGKIDPKRILVIQNENDPFASYEEVLEFVKKISPQIRVFKMPRSDHHYPYYDFFTQNI